MTKTSQNTPELNFQELIDEPTVYNNLTEKMGFEKPTPIQSAVIQSVREGKDVYAGAKTGSGKTVAFIAPIAEMLYKNKIKKALVLCPVRELALQIDEEAMHVLGAEQRDVLSMPLYGGVPLDTQLRALKANKPRLLVATPGRFMDFIEEGLFDLADFEVCVLDEADRMCDMGFAPQVSAILDILPNRKQTLMFSATLPKKADVIMSQYLNDPYKVQVDRPDESSSTIDHKAVYCTGPNKIRKLNDFLDGDVQSSLIFVRTRKGGDRVFDTLKRDRQDVGILHAGYSMNDRERTIRAFKAGKLRHLVATDVAARGLDVKEVNLVIHFELPEALDDYIHRSGRAGRAGREGVSVAFVDPRNFQQKQQIEFFQKTIKIEFLNDSGKASDNEGRSRGPRQRGRSGKAKPNTRGRSPQNRGPKKSKKTRSHRSDAKAAPKAKSTKKPKNILSKTKKVFKNIFKSKK